MPVGWTIKLLPYCAVYNLVTGGALGQPPPVSSPCGLVLLPGEEASSHHSTRPPATQPRPQQRCMCCSFFLSHSAGLREAAGQDAQSPSPYRNLTYCGASLSVPRSLPKPHMHARWSGGWKLLGPRQLSSGKPVLPP